MGNSLQLIGMAKKAGLLAVGGEAVAIAARQGKARLIVSASDASGGSIRRARNSAETGGAEYIDVRYTRFELGQTAGRGSPGTIAFLEAGLAAGFVKGLADGDPGQYEALRQRLEEKNAVKRRKRSGPPGKKTEKRRTAK